MTLLRILGIHFSKLINRILDYDKDPLLVQRKVLSNIIKVNKKTLFGKEHDFESIKSIRDFQKRCPVRKYTDFEPYIKKMIKGKQNILVGSKQIYWGKTAGSSGIPKLIPITRKSVLNASKCSLRAILSYIAENPRENSKILDGIMYFYSSDPYLEDINGIPVGFGTGAFDQSSTNQFLKHFRFNLYSPSKFYQINDFKTRTNAMVSESYDLNITSFFGVTSILINLMETMLEKAPDNGYNADKLIDLFPNYVFSIMGGEPFRFYENRLNQIVGREIDCREIYGATEETIAIQMGEKKGLTPMLDVNFYEFIPVKKPNERLLINEVKKNEEYMIILTNYNGLYSYNIEDVVEFLSIDPPLIQFKRRLNTMNLASEKLTIDQLDYSIKQADRKMNGKVKDYIICGIFDPKPRYVLLIEFIPNAHPDNYKEYLKEFNLNLMEISSIYEALIKTYKAIYPPIMWVLEDNSFRNFQLKQLQAGKPAGQTKFPRISVDQDILTDFQEMVMKKIEI
ncbi:MAG: hypothetical protein GF329_13770 [Candidatus Lokiarchaeota archaeon]|nr:hypothetical protein [Candidatus Lokiarchaeota archaeon]